MSPSPSIASSEALHCARCKDVQHALLAAVVESSDDAIFSESLDGTISSWNPAAERIFGFSAAEAIGRPTTLIVPEELLAEEQEIFAKVRNGHRVAHLETARIVKGGGRIEVCLRVSAIRDEHGSIVGTSKIAHDISELKSVEAQLHDINRRKDEFIAMLGHELRNPLAPIANGIVLIRRLASNNPDVSLICDMFERQIATMRRLLDDLLDIGRLTQGRIRFVRQPLDLQPVIQAAVEMCRPALERQRHHLQVSMPAQPMRVLGDATRLTQALANLLSNAIKYTPDGGEIALGADQRASHIVLRVRDNGIGIETALLPTIFEPFIQGHPCGSKPQTGLGIGLALARSILRAHEGSIEAVSAGPGHGTEMTISLPVLDEEH